MEGDGENGNIGINGNSGNWLGIFTLIPIIPKFPNSQNLVGARVREN